MDILNIDNVIRDSRLLLSLILFLVLLSPVLMAILKLVLSGLIELPQLLMTILWLLFKSGLLFLYMILSMFFVALGSLLYAGFVLLPKKLFDLSLKTGKTLYKLDQRIYEQIWNDWQLEYTEAMKGNHVLKACWLTVCYCWAFAQAVIQRSPYAFISLVFGKFKLARRPHE